MSTHMTSVMFDFFGVVWSEVGTPWFLKHFSPERALEIRETYCPPSDKGEMSEDVFFNTIGALVHACGDDVRSEWIDAVQLNQDVVSLVRDLKKHYKVAGLSNSQPAFFRDIMEKFSLGGLFDDVVVSSEVGLIKPNKEIFDFILTRLGAAPYETIFIDDRESNVAAAENIGMRGIVFQNATQLRNDLSALGLLLSDR